MTAGTGDPPAGTGGPPTERRGPPTGKGDPPTERGDAPTERGDAPTGTGSFFSLEPFVAARRRIRDRIHHTPLSTATLLGRRAGVRLSVKAENLQKTGSFKPRGVLNKLLQLTEEERGRGVVTVSAGNHAQALAWGASTAGIASTVVMPSDAPRTKVEASRSYGATVVLEETVFDAFDEARRLSREEGLVFVHPFDDPEIVAGQGTVGLEIVEDVEELDAVVVPVGGGGLISGVAAAVKLSRPGVRIFGVEPEGAAAMRESLDAGEPVRLDRVDTVADGLGSPMAGELTFRMVERYVDDVVVISDREITEAVGELLSWTKLLTEPAGAAATAALLADRLPLEEEAAVVSVLSGGNVDLSRLEEML